MPLAEALAKQGIHGIGIPVMGGGMDIKEMIKLAESMGYRHNSLDNVPPSLNDLPFRCQGCGGIEKDKDCPKKNLQSNGVCQLTLMGDK